MVARLFKAMAKRPDLNHHPMMELVPITSPCGSCCLLVPQPLKVLNYRKTPNQQEQTPNPQHWSLKLHGGQQGESHPRAGGQGWGEGGSCFPEFAYGKRGFC